MDRGWIEVALPLALLAVAAVLAIAWHRWRRARPAAASLPSPDVDPVSGLPSRGLFEDRLDDAVHACDRDGTALALLYLNLDSFGIVNDAYGHEAGDRVLAKVAQRLLRSVPESIACARNAGDEFMIALPGPVDRAIDACERARQALRRSFTVEGHDFTIDASIGIALYPQHGARPRLLMQATAAMRAVKRAGGGGHAVFEPAMAVDMREQAVLLSDLRAALPAGSFKLVYQPKIDARSLQVTAAEALLRWHCPQRGIVPPSVFVPLAEKHGLIGEIGRWVIEEACRQAAVWREQGLRMRVAVNVSGSQLRQDDWVEHLVGCLRQHGIPPSRFTCEITESVAMEDTRVTREAFARLREAGVHVSIDDFGTGHSSLAALRTLPAAELKIDRSFVADLETSADARSIAATIVKMAHQLELRVVAEGVETEAQRDWLMQAGCDELQGWLFAKPMGASALGIWASGEQGPTALGFRESLFRETLPQTIAGVKAASAAGRTPR